MTKLALALAASLLSAAAFAASPAATRDWVRQYVATNGAYKTTITQTVSTNDAVARISYTNDDGRVISMTMNMHDKLALGVTNCTAAAVALGVTNGTLFAWNGSNSFENAALGLSILTSGTNGLSFAGVTSHTNATHDVIDGYFWLYGVRIDRPTSRALLGAPLAASTRFADAFARFVGEILVPSAAADTWGDIAGWDYKPKYESYGTDYSWLVNDDKGNVGVVQYDKDGIPTQASLENVMKDLRLNVSSLFKNCANLASTIIYHDMMLQEIDIDLTALDERLDSAFAEIFGKLKNLETDESSPDGSGTEKTSYEIVEKSETKIVLKGGVAAAYVDNASISLNKKDAKNPKYQLYGFSDDSTKNQMLPYRSGSTLAWNRIGFFADGSSLQQNFDNQDPSSGFAIQLGLMNWNTPGKTPTACDESLATQLAAPADQPPTHYVLTKHIQNGQLHYTPVGHFTGGATPDETTITTNGTPKDALQIKGPGTKNHFLVSQQGEKTPPAWQATEQLTVITGIEGELEDGKLKLKLTKKIIQAYIDPDVTQPSEPEEVELLNAPEEEVVVYTEYDTSEHEFYDHIKTVRVVESSDTSPRRRDVPTFTATEHE